MWRLMCLIPTLVLAQPDTAQPDPRDLIRRSADAIKQFKSYELESVVFIDMQGGPIRTKMELPSKVAVRRPDRMRIESRSQAGSITIVSDGDHTWFYMTPLKKYIRRDASGLPEAAVGNSGLLPKNLPDVSKSIKSVRLTHEEEISVAGEAIACWVIETTYDSINLPEQELAIEDATQITWISKKHGLNLQTRFSAKLNLPGVNELVKMTQSTQTTALRLNVDLPESLFVFAPPEGAKETEDWTLPGITKPDLINKPAPEFQVKSLHGDSIDLEALHGKVVLLDFWTTWSAPSRRDLPLLEKLQSEFRDQGLVVIGLDVAEPPSTREAFLKTTPLSYAVAAIDDQIPLMTDLAVTAFPTTVLIDREGNIVSYEAGARGEAALRNDLAKLGLKH
jgi:outer membrane lipoprotein-sorting protein/peroxiredoxin